MKTFTIGLLTIISIFSILYGIGYVVNLLIEIPSSKQPLLLPFIGTLSCIGIGGFGGIIYRIGKEIRNNLKI